MIKKQGDIAKKVILSLTGIVIVIYIAGFIHLRQNNTHGWIINIVQNNQNDRNVLDSVMVIDTNVKTSVLTVEEYVVQKKWDEEKVRPEVIEYVGKKPWGKPGIYPNQGVEQSK